MPSATIPRAVTAQQAAEVLKEQLGSGYKVTPHKGGSRQKLTVSHGGVAFATVHLVPDGNATTFHVHGGGLIVGRLSTSRHRTDSNRGDQGFPRVCTRQRRRLTRRTSCSTVVSPHVTAPGDEAGVAAGDQARPGSPAAGEQRAA